MKNLRRFAKALFLVTFLLVSVGAAYGSWQDYDKPAMGEYLFYNGSTSTQPDLVLQKFIVPQSIMNELVNLPDFSQKKLSSGDAADVDTYNLPDIYKWVTRHDEHLEYLKDLMNTSTGKTRMNMKLLGEYPLGYPMALCVFTKPGSGTPPPLEPDEVRALNKPIVWLQGPIHGGEQDAYGGLQYVMWKLASGQWDHYLDKVSIVVFPRINTDGARNMTRGSTIRSDKVIHYAKASDKPASSKFMNHQIATNIDMNRDNLWFDMQSLRALHTAWNSYAPELAADHHQMGMTHNFGDNGFIASDDAAGNPVMMNGRVALLVSRDAAGKPILDANGNLINLNTEKAVTYYKTTDITTQHGDHLNNPLVLREYFIDKMEPFIKSFLSSKGVGHDLYVVGASGFRGGGASLNPDAYAPYYPDGTTPDGTGVKWNGYLEGAEFDPVHMFNAIPLKPCLSILIESASSTSSAIRYPKRVFSQLTTAEALIKYGADHADEVRKLIADVRSDIATRGKTYDPTDMVVNTMWYRSTPTLRSFPSYNASGDLVDLKINLYNTRNGVPIIQRVRPVAYILKKNATNTDVVKRLTFNGATVEVLDEDALIEVEAYRNLREAPWHHPVTNLIMTGTPDVEGSYSDRSKYLYDPKLVPWTPPMMAVSDGVTKEKIQFHKGDYVIYMDTYAARIIATSIEADAERSFTRWSMAHKKYADPSAEICVPYRYMDNARLNTSQAFVILPEALNAFIADIDFLSGPALDTLNTETAFGGGTVKFAEDLSIETDTGIVSFKFPRALIEQGFDGSSWFLFDWSQNAWVKQDADYRASTQSQGLTIAPTYISDQGLVRIAAVGEGVTPPKDGGGSSGCNAITGAFLLVLLIPLTCRYRNGYRS